MKKKKLRWVSKGLVTVNLQQRELAGCRQVCKKQTLGSFVFNQSVACVTKSDNRGVLYDKYIYFISTALY